MKLMFVGVANIGKTTLLAKLREDGVTNPGWHERREVRKVIGRWIYCYYTTFVILQISIYLQVFITNFDWLLQDRNPFLSWQQSGNFVRKM